SLSFCLICETIGNGKCIKNGTICQCLDGYSGETCLDSTEVTLFETTTMLQKDTHIVNVSAVILGALAGFLCILIIGLLHFLYSLIRSSRVYRRGLITQLLKMFDNDSSNTLSSSSSSSSLTLEEQLFVADNLAYFPYQVQDEPLFIVEQIDLSISVIGSTQLQQFRDLLKQHLDYIDDDEGIDMNKIENKLNNVSEIIIDELNQCLRTTKPTMLLLLLKSYLKDVYYLNDTKIIEYDHTESTKITDRPILTRKINIKFEPKIILDTIKPLNINDPLQKRKQIIKEFADFKRYLLAFDMDIE
ncbi:unnamed protein product, partial [Rotaria sp. Silwood1]